jgi:hypothetical protein
VGFAWDELAALASARQFPVPPDGVAAMVHAIGPIQSQTARSPFIGLAARFPGVTHEAISAAYEEAAIVRGSTIRGTVHTATPDQFAVVGAATRVGQRAVWQRMLRLEHASLERLWADTETFAADWRTPDELTAHLHAWLVRHESAGSADRVLAHPGGRYLAFGHGGLVRRPARGGWDGQGAPAYRTLRAPVPGLDTTPTLDDAVVLHLSRHGPASRHDIAWWSGLGLRGVDEVIDRLGLVGEHGPDGRTYVDVPGGPRPRPVEGVRLLPEFDALMCGYDPAARERFGQPAHLRRLWNLTNGLVAPPLLVDGRITGYWRAPGTAPRRPLDVVWFAGTRRPRKAELAAPVAALETALGITVTDVTVTRETV